MTRKFDLIAIGTESAASGVTSRCREAGWKVAIVDSRLFGGTCALRGCDPKKVLVGAAEAVDWTRRIKGRGIQAAMPSAARTRSRFGILAGVAHLTKLVNLDQTSVRWLGKSFGHSIYIMCLEISNESFGL